MDIGCRRLVSHHLAGNPCESPAAVVAAMGAMQAQDYGQALWAIAARTDGATFAEVERAVDDREILRTWPMRGTLHFIPAQNARWMLNLTADRLFAASKRRRAQLELDDATLARSQALFADVLQGGRRATRADMMAALETDGIVTTEQRGYHLLWHAANAGRICLGPVQGKEQTFVDLDAWVPTPRTLGREEGLGELARTYFRSHGPATVHDFAWWIGLPLKDARIGLEAAQSELVTETFAGREYWAASQGPKAPGRSVRLLPGFDEFLLGYQDRTAVLSEAHAQKVIPGKNGIFQPILVVDGQVAGTWKRQLKAKSAHVAIAPFVPMREREDEMREAAEAFCRAVSLPLGDLKIQA